MKPSYGLDYQKKKKKNTKQFYDFSAMTSIKHNMQYKYVAWRLIFKNSAVVNIHREIVDQPIVRWDVIVW